MQKINPPWKEDSLFNAGNWIGKHVIVTGYNHCLEGKRGTVTRVVQMQMGPHTVIELHQQDATVPLNEYTIDPNNLVQEM